MFKDILKKSSSFILTLIPWLALIGLGGFNLGLFHFHQNKNELVNRIWIDHWPESEHDKLHMFVLGGADGAYQYASPYQGYFDTFLVERVTDELFNIRMLQDLKKYSVTYVIERVGGSPDFDRKLIIDGSPFPQKEYFSNDELEFDKAGNVKNERVNKILHHK